MYSTASTPESVTVNSEDIQLLNLLQQDFPLTRRPFAAIADRLGRTEAGVVKRLDLLHKAGVISRLGAVFNHEKAGASTLVAMAVPASAIDAVAAHISALPQVNHNYLREDLYNLWFVVTASRYEEIEALLAQLAQWPGYPILDLPMQRAYHIDLGFPLC